MPIHYFGSVAVFVLFGHIFQLFTGKAFFVEVLKHVNNLKAFSYGGKIVAVNIMLFVLKIFKIAHICYLWAASNIGFNKIPLFPASIINKNRNFNNQILKTRMRIDIISLNLYA